MDYRAVLFDFDYTLGDATEAICAGFRYAMAEMGLPQPTEEAVRGTIGMLVVDAYTLLTGDRREEQRNRFYALFHPVARDLQAQGKVKLFPGALALMKGLKAAGAATAVVSTKNQESLDTVLGHTGLSAYVDLAVGNGPLCSRAKPDPAGTLLALEQLGVPPEAALFCGDTVIDARTAQNAGVAFCAVLNGTTPAGAFSGCPHVHIAPDLPALKDWLGV